MHHAIRTLVGVAATAFLVGPAFAQVTATCPAGSTRITGPALPTLFGGNTLCAASSTNTDTWQEYHQGTSSGSLIDWKRGPGHPVDPTGPVGSWSAGNDANAVLTHTYGASSYSWLVCQVNSGNNFTLVSTAGAASITGATVKAGQGSCAALPLAARPAPSALRRQ